MKDIELDELSSRIKEIKLSSDKSTQLFSLITTTYRWVDVDKTIRPVMFNWEKNSALVIKYLREKFNKELFNWNLCSGLVARNDPKLIDCDKYNWKYFSSHVARNVPELIEHDRFNWEETPAVIKYAPHLISRNINKIDTGRFGALIKRRIK